jgi:hypothetical protein
MDPKRYNIANRAAEKQASSDEDADRLARGEITGAELRVENNFFASLDMSRFKIVAIGGRPIKFDKDTAE